MENADIDWLRIGAAVEFYKARGFCQVETPWVVEQKNAAITCNDTSRMVKGAFHHSEAYDKADPVLVGSAEQGFLDLLIRERYQDPEMYEHFWGTKVNFVSAGPCFRDEPCIDDIHQFNFFKVELFCRCETHESASYAAKELTHRAMQFMSQYAMPKIVHGDNHGWDLEINGIEVGSYGTRYHKSIGWWAYGTGLAEPRFSIALDQY